MSRSEQASSAPRPWRTDAALVAQVVALIVSARLLWWMPWPITIAAVLAGVASLRPRWALIALLLLIGARAGGALDALEPTGTAPLVSSTVTIVEDPRPSGQSIRAIVRHDGQNVMLRIRSAQAGAMRTAAAGDQLRVTGTLRGSPPQSDWAISRRIVGQIVATEVTVTRSAGGLVGAANSVRATIRGGAATLGHSRQVLFTGLVFGDDRGQDVIVTDNFRASGLGHLLAVSGQNVVFVLLLASPLLTRIRSVPIRVALAISVLVAFGFLTRFEPSVTRALVMAGLVVGAAAIGRPGAAATVLPIAVGALLLLDPLLAWSLAFQLSVTATLGLVVLTPRIVTHIPGPEPIRLALAATIAAQLAVSPLLFASFGQVSVIAVPANLLAGPAAAGVMMWGLVAGFVAGIGPPVLAGVVHVPTRLMLWWIDGVASIAAQIDLGHVTIWHLVGTVIAAISWTSARGHRWVALVLAMLSIGLPVLTPRQLPAGEHHLADAVTVVRSSDGHDVVLIGANARSDDLIESLRQARLGRIDLVIAETGGRDVGRSVALVRTRFSVTEIWAPTGHQVPGARTVDPIQGTIGALEIWQDSDGSIIVGEQDRPDDD